MAEFDLSKVSFAEAETTGFGRIKDNSEIKVSVIPRKTSNSKDTINLSIRNDVVDRWKLDRLTAAVVKAGNLERLYIKVSETGFKGQNPNHGKGYKGNRTYFHIRTIGNLKDYFKYEGSYKYLNYDKDNDAFYVEL